MSAPLLAVSGLAKHFAVTRGFLRARHVGLVRAVDGVSFSINRGETLALVGESGCGKSTTGRLVLRLIDTTAGAIRFQSEDITRVTGTPLRRLRREMQIVFQDPYASLNPRMTVADILGEPLALHGIAAGAERAGRVQELLAVVGLSPHHAVRYPHEFSGGQRQRIGIARAIATEPKLIVADEPVSALDVSIRAQVINLMIDLRERLGLSYLFISHDLAVVHHLADRVAVMYRGRIVEHGAKTSVFATPRHPYTRALLAAALPPAATHGALRPAIQGDAPGNDAGGPGCGFAPRCPFAQARCHSEAPDESDAGATQRVSCHYWDQLPEARRGAYGPATESDRARLASLQQAFHRPTRSSTIAAAHEGGQA
ncbi:MAG: ATP-binding cassette domain-containing protein [Alphaproteobacteria bacterium]|nr:ATP-binding cassette domain-containing protein [Alphaproteobacteria bacterium]